MTKHAGGRPPFKPTDEERKQVKAMSGYGVPHDQIAALIGGGIDRNTLRKHFRGELDAGMATANARIGQLLFEKCQEKDTAALIWWTKARMGWKSEVDVNVGGQEDNPIKVEAKTFVSVEEAAKVYEDLIKGVE